MSENGRRLFDRSNEETPDTQTGLLWFIEHRAESKMTKLWSGTLSAKRCASFHNDPSSDAATLVVASEQVGHRPDDAGWQLQIYREGRPQLPKPEVVPNVVSVNHIAWSPKGDLFNLSLRFKESGLEQANAMLYWCRMAN